MQCALSYCSNRVQRPRSRHFNVPQKSNIDVAFDPHPCRLEETPSKGALDDFEAKGRLFGSLPIRIGSESLFGENGIAKHVKYIHTLLFMAVESPSDGCVQGRLHPSSSQLFHCVQVRNLEKGYDHLQSDLVEIFSVMRSLFPAFCRLSGSLNPP